MAAAPIPACVIPLRQGPFDVALVALRELRRVARTPEVREWIRGAQPAQDEEREVGDGRRWP